MMSKRLFEAHQEKWIFFADFNILCHLFICFFAGGGKTWSMYVQSQEVVWYVHEGLAYIDRVRLKTSQ